ncbi:TRAP transporter small permease subunit [Ahrensia sp. R2A130]|uniref:TRAP transporter small permease subunit n=1 Tax=Ahrensia sp. R2A130 TaxID=744979 RepID=UPI0001E0BC9C|nr:TRAP transporter small permease subunit [Ahrensia sp. R2A130]EFL88765.1 tripartite ATP-independent periplasmic transporter DctQ [Ahrensia sp. R2A130]
MEREPAFQPGIWVKALHGVAALALLAACLLQVSVVGLRAAGIGLLWGQELVAALCAVAILTGSASTLAQNRLVRIDVWSAGRSEKLWRVLEKVGTVLFLLPFSLCLIWFGWTYATESWLIGEGSAEISGLPGRYAIKFLIPLFAVSLLLAGLAKWRRS